MKYFSFNKLFVAFLLCSSLLFLCIGACEGVRQSAFSELNSNNIKLYEWSGGLNGWLGLKEIKLFADPTIAAIDRPPAASKRSLDLLIRCQKIHGFSFVNDASFLRPDFINGMSQLPKLTALSFDWCFLSSECWAAVGSLKHIRIIEINETKLTDSDLASLGGVRDLEELYITSEKITISGLQSLRHLKLKKIHLVETPRITKSAIPQIQQIFPSANISITTW